eukprot:4816299-Pleurochrysis_carterae.AAC.2
MQKFALRYLMRLSLPIQNAESREQSGMLKSNFRSRQRTRRRLQPRPRVQPIPSNCSSAAACAASRGKGCPAEGVAGCHWRSQNG